MNSAIQIIKGLGYLIFFASFIFIVAVSTKFIAGKRKKSMKGSYINIIESVSLGVDKQIHLIKVGQQFVLVATAGKNVEFLTNLSLNEYVEESTEQAGKNVFDFKSIFDKYLSSYKNKKNSKTTAEERSESINNSSEGDVFKSNLDRLKNITSRMNKNSNRDGDDNTNEE